VFSKSKRVKFERTENVKRATKMLHPHNRYHLSDLLCRRVKKLS
jgi:hypothetical protein